MNELELNGKYLGSISSDFVKIADILKDTAYQIKVRKLSEYPIFVICKEIQSIGQLLISKKEHATTWHYYASFLSEFVQRELVSIEKIELFKQNYKNIDEFCCLFVVDKEFTNFVFIPYPED